MIRIWSSPDSLVAARLSSPDFINGIDPKRALGGALSMLRAPDGTDRLLSTDRAGDPFRSHLRSLMGCDEPDTLSDAIVSICQISADGGQQTLSTRLR